MAVDHPRTSEFATGHPAAADLCDQAVDRLFSVRMALRNALTLPTRAEADARVQAALGDLDDAVARIRGAGAALASADPAARYPAVGLRARIADVVTRTAAPAGRHPTLTLHGPLDVVADARGGALLLDVLAEAVTSLTRRTQAGIATVQVRAERDPRPGRFVAHLAAEASVGSPGLPGLSAWSARFNARLEPLGGHADLHLGARQVYVRWTLPAAAAA
jgi:hypothetical protein